MIDLNLLKWSGGVLAGVAWFVLVLMGKADSTTFVQFAQMVLVGLGAHGMTLRPRVVEVTTPPAVVNKEAGKVSILILLVIIAVICFLSGCTSMILDNRVSCTVGHDKAFFISEYGAVGIAATIAEADKVAICGGGK